MDSTCWPKLSTMLTTIYVVVPMRSTGPYATSNPPSATSISLPYMTRLPTILQNVALGCGVGCKESWPKSLPLPSGNSSEVSNQSTTQLSPTEISILSHGLKFNSADANNIDFLGNLESILQNSPIPEEAGADIRSAATSQLRNNNPSYQTTVEEKRAITSFKNDPNITNLPADKGGATVAMDKADYKEKALQQLSDTEIYTILTTDPTPKQTRAIQKTLDRLVREETLPATTARTLSPKETSIARPYDLPKIHKTGNPLRMIVSLAGCLTTWNQL